MKILRNCVDCLYFVRLAEDEPNSFGDGECYRYPPSSSNKQEDTGCQEELYLRPIVHGRHGWCGEFTKTVTDDFSHDSNVPLRDLSLTVRSFGCLYRSRITTLGEIEALIGDGNYREYRRSSRKIKNLGQRSFFNIKNAVSEYKDRIQ